MARNTGDQQRDQTARRSAAGANSAGRSAADRNANDRGPSRRADQERSIQTNREDTHASRGQPSPNRSQPPGAMAPRRDGSRPHGLSSGAAASPFSAMRRMAEDMERLFDALGFGRSAFGYSPGLAEPLDSAIDRDVWRDASPGRASWSPQAEMFRRGDHVVVRADLPGVKKDDVQVHVDDGVLTISGERKASHEERGDDFYRTERSYGRFFRSFALPEGVSGDHCEASFNDGVLEVTLAAPKQQERSRRINIR